MEAILDCDENWFGLIRVYAVLLLLIPLCNVLL